MEMIATAILCIFWSSWLHNHCMTSLAASNLKGNKNAQVWKESKHNHNVPNFITGQQQFLNFHREKSIEKKLLNCSFRKIFMTNKTAIFRKVGQTWADAPAYPPSYLGVGWGGLNHRITELGSLTWQVSQLTNWGGGGEQIGISSYGFFAFSIATLRGGCWLPPYTFCMDTTQPTCCFRSSQGLAVLGGKWEEAPIILYD